MLVARSELIVGQPGSGRGRRARALASAWLALSPAHQAVSITTPRPWERARRQWAADHAAPAADSTLSPLGPVGTAAVRGLRTTDDPFALAHALGPHGRGEMLVVVDCLTLWLTVLLMPAVPRDDGSAAEGVAEGAAEPSLAAAIAGCAGPLVLLGNDVAPEVQAWGRDGARFADALGGMERRAAAACERVTLMSGGLPLPLKGSA